MTGADAIIETAVAAGIEVCFANPGTTEIPLVQAIDNAPQMRAVLGLFEGVCTGAADGYARMADKPALTLLHLGPGFANGIAYLHDARRARSSIVNLIGEHATWHIPADPPLHSDIESLAAPVSHFVRRNKGAEFLSTDTADAITAAQVFPGKISSLILPNDFLLADAPEKLVPARHIAAPEVDPLIIVQAAKILRDHPASALFLGGHALRGRGLLAAARIAAVTNCELICESFPTRLERGAGLPVLKRLPYFPEAGRKLLAPFSAIILAGARNPVTFFGYPHTPSFFIAPEQENFALAAPEENTVAALEALATELGAPENSGHFADLVRPEIPTGQLTPEKFTAVVADLQPENAIIMEEGISSVAHYFVQSGTAPHHTYLAQSGGAIGLGLPCATGAAIACPARPVITLQSDGAAMYTFQSLWTQARESLNVTTLLCNNRRYQILALELKRAGVAQVGAKAQSMIDLDQPEINFTQLAQSLGVPAVRVETAEALARELQKALAEAGPHLIEMML